MRGDEILGTFELAGLAVRLAARASVQERPRGRAAAAERLALQAHVRARERAGHHVDVALLRGAVMAVGVRLHPGGERVAERDVERSGLGGQRCRLAGGGRGEGVRAQHRQPGCDGREDREQVVSGNQGDDVRG